MCDVEKRQWLCFAKTRPFSAKFLLGHTPVQLYLQSYALKLSVGAAVLPKVCVNTPNRLPFVTI